MEMTMIANSNCAVSIADQDLELLETSTREDVGAFEEIVCRYDRTLLRIAQVVLHNPEEAHEVVKVTFVKAFENLGTFPRDAKVSTWLIQIALNESLVRLGMQRAMWEGSLENTPQGEVNDNAFATGESFIMNASYWAPSLDGLYTRTELREILARSLRRLPPTLRLIFVLKDIDGHSIADTAEILSLTPVAVQTRLSRARMLLRQELNPYFKV